MSKLSVLLVLFMLLSTNVSYGEPVVPTVTERYYHDISEAVTDWQVSLRFLKEGNNRYLAGLGIRRDIYAESREILKYAQKPFAVIVTCADSRVAPEIYFDQRLGDIFVVRNAGNIADATALGSIEFAVGHLGAPLVVVVGHSACGAVAGALAQGAEFSENLQAVINKIKPAVENKEDLDAAILANIRHVAGQIKANAVVAEMGATVLGAHYDIATGKVSFIED